MAKTLLDILISANAVLDLDASQPTGTEQTTRANYANQAVWDASATGQLSEFKKEFLTTTSTLATIPLPTDFREFQDWPHIATNGGWQGYEPINVEDKYDRSSDYVCWVLGNPAEGYNLVLNNVIASATVSVIYQRYPSGLLTLTDECELSDPQYVTRKIESYVLYSRSDDRFNIAEGRAQQTLANMMGREMKGVAGLGRATTPSTFKNPLRNG
jgi:hypothetical protein